MLNPRLEDHRLSAVRNCLFNTFAAILHIWKPSLPSSTWGRDWPWWELTHSPWLRRVSRTVYIWKNAASCVKRAILKYASLYEILCFRGSKSLYCGLPTSCSHVDDKCCIGWTYWIHFENIMLSSKFYKVLYDFSPECSVFTPQMALALDIKWFHNILQLILRIGFHGLGLLVRFVA
jgi:hypothetical protein